MQYFVVMIDYGRRGREAIVDPEITKREVISRVASGEYSNISFIHEIADSSVEDITADNKKVIQECKDDLQKARTEIKDYVDKLGPSLKDIGKKAAEEMSSKLDEMDKFIAKKEEDLQNQLKDKQTAAIKAIWPAMVTIVTWPGSTFDCASMRRMMMSWRPPRDESATVLPRKSAMDLIPGPPTRSCSGRSTNSITVRTLMPRMTAATAEPMVAAYWMSPASNTRMFSAAGITTISPVNPSCWKKP